MLAFALPFVLAFVPLTADKATHTVTFTARATSVSPDTTLEFAFVGPNSDRAYEAMFVTDATVEDLAKAFEDAGIARGKPVSPRGCRFWPTGKCVTIEPSLKTFIADRDKSKPTALRYTGGKREGAGVPDAHTNMPAAVFSLYSHDQSLLLADDAQDQSQVYGRFTATGKVREGDRVTFKVSWDGKSETESRRLELAPGKVREAIASLKVAATDLDVLPVFSPDLTVTEAKAAATALSVIDSMSVKVNGFEPGQIFYRGFLPDEKWRDRTKRLTQPLEARLSDTNVVYTIIDENWEVEGTDPELKPHDEPLDKVRTIFKGDTCIFYARANDKLSRLYALMKQLPSTVRNWYVYVD